MIIDILLWCIYPNIINTYRYKNDKYKFEYTEPYDVYDISVDDAIYKINTITGIKYYNLEILDNLGYTIVNNTMYELDGVAYKNSNIIKIRSDDGWYILFTLCHEIHHLLYPYANELYVEYHTWKLLYESDDIILRDRAICELHQQLKLFNNVADDYNITRLCYEYLKENNNIYIN